MQISAFQKAVSYAALCGALVAMASGCSYGSMQNVLRSQVAAEIKCPEVAVTSQLPFEEGYKEGQYKVAGCGVERLYTCPDKDGLVSYDSHLCTFADSHEQKPVVAAPTPDAMDESTGSADAPPPDDAMDAPAATPEPEPAKPAKSTFKPSGRFKASSN